LTGLTVGTTENTSSLNLNIYFSRGSDGNARTGSLGIQSNTFDTWGVQVEYGSKATPFQTATGTIQGELAACQRYYYRTQGFSSYSTYGSGIASNATNANIFVPFQTKMRTQPTVLDFSILALTDGATWTAITSATLLFNSVGNGGAIQAVVASGLTQFRPYILTSNNDAAGYIGFGAEL
jgi:hypothetical protein